MAEEKGDNSVKVKRGIWLLLGLGLMLVVAHSALDVDSPVGKLPVKVLLKNGNSIFLQTEGISSKTIKLIRRAVGAESAKPETAVVSGKILIETPDRYHWYIDYLEPVAFWIDGKPVIRSPGSANQGRVRLNRGFHDFKMEIPLRIGRNTRLKIRWKHSGLVKWTPVRQEIFVAPDTPSGVSGKISELYQRKQRFTIIKSVIIYLFVLFFLYLSLVATGISQEKNLPVNTASFSRIGSIDVTKGFAAFLMVTGHSSGAIVLLPFADFGADLFFFCSGMNTYLFLTRFKKNRGITPFHLFFSALLFFGGYTQIVIAHPGERRLIPDFFQFIALGMILILVLIKLLKNSGNIGYFFWVPFLLHFAYKFEWLPFLHVESHWRKFLFWETGFSLFPWAGFMLFGIFILNFRRNTRIIALILISTAVVSSILIVICRIPVTRYDMSLSYVALSLFVLTFLFFVFERIIPEDSSGVISVIQSNLALVGRNALMLVYIHYFILRYLVPQVPDFSAVVELIFRGLIAFVFCVFFLSVYEKIKFNESLFYPLLLFLIFLLVSRYGGLFVANIDLHLIDMVIGVVFAFIYIELRRKMRSWVRTA